MTDLPRPVDDALTGATKASQSHEPTYSGALSFARRPYEKSPQGADVIVWGVPLDTAVSHRPGARFGPAAIRKASVGVAEDAVHPFGFDPFTRLTCVDAGDAVWDYGRLDAMPGHIERQAKAHLDTGAKLVSLGGDHFMTLPLLRAHHAVHGPLALVQFDAHQDTWEDDGTRIDHGTIITRAVAEGLIDPDRSIQIGIRTIAPQTCGLEIVTAEEAWELGPQEVGRKIYERVGGQPAYLTFDIDALDPAHAPGTGTPVCGGLTTREALATLGTIKNLDWKGFDVAEVSPPYDHADITALAGATVAMHMICVEAGKREAE